MNLKKFTKSMIGDGWKDERNKLYKLKSGMRTKSMAEVEADVPDGVDPEQWRRYIGWRMSDLGQARSEWGKKARAQQQVSHTTGSRPMIVGYDEMVILISTSL